MYECERAQLCQGEGDKHGYEWMLAHKGEYFVEVIHAKPFRLLVNLPVGSSYFGSCMLA